MVVTRARGTAATAKATAATGRTTNNASETSSTSKTKSGVSSIANILAAAKATSKVDATSARRASTAATTATATATATGGDQTISQQQSLPLPRLVNLYHPWLTHGMNLDGIIILAFEEIRWNHPDLYTQLCRKWISAQCWVTAMNKRITNLPKVITTTEFNHAFDTSFSYYKQQQGSGGSGNGNYAMCYYHQIHNNFHPANPTFMTRIKRCHNQYYYYVIERKYKTIGPNITTTTATTTNSDRIRGSQGGSSKGSAGGQTNNDYWYTPIVPPHEQSATGGQWNSEVKKASNKLLRELEVERIIPLPPLQPTKQFAFMDLRNHPTMNQSIYGMSILAFEEIRCNQRDLYVRLCRKWVTDESWVQVIRSRISNFPVHVDITVPIFNESFDQFESYQNITDNYSINNKNSNSNSNSSSNKARMIRTKRQNTYYYYVLEGQKIFDNKVLVPPDPPPTTKGIRNWISKAKRDSIEALQGLPPPILRPEREIWLKLQKQKKETTTEEEENPSPAAKRQKTAAAADAAKVAAARAAAAPPAPPPQPPEVTAGTPTTTTTAGPQPPPVATGAAGTPTATQDGSSKPDITQFTYWKSGIAKSLFRPRDDETVEECLQRRIQRLKRVNMTADGWREMIADGDPENRCKPFHIQDIQQKAAVLCQTYNLVLSGIEGGTFGTLGNTFTRYCEEAVKQLNAMGFTRVKTFRIVAGLNMQYRIAESIPHPNPPKPLEEPPLFQKHPAIKKAMLDYWRDMKHLKASRTEDCYDFLLPGPIRDAFLKEQEEGTTKAKTVEEFVNISILRRRMAEYGIVHHSHKKKFYWVKTPLGEAAGEDAEANNGDHLKNQEGDVIHGMAKELMCEPRFLRTYPHIKEALMDYCRKNRKKMSRVSAHKFLMEGVIADAFQTFLTERKQHPLHQNEVNPPTMQYWFKQFNLKKVCPNSVMSWAKYYGYRYSKKKKSWYFLGEYDDDEDEKDRTNNGDDDNDDDDDDDDSALYATAGEEDDDVAIQRSITAVAARHPRHGNPYNNQGARGGHYNMFPNGF